MVENMLARILARLCTQQRKKNKRGQHIASANGTYETTGAGVDVCKEAVASLRIVAERRAAAAAGSGAIISAT